MRFLSDVTNPLWDYTANIHIFAGSTHILQEKFYKPNSFLSRCTVETDTSHSLEVRLMLVPRRSSRSTSLYSSILVSLDLMLPAFRPTLPPLAMYRALPLLRRNLMVSRSISAQVPNTDMKMLRNGFLVPSGWNIERFSF